MFRGPLYELLKALKARDGDFDGQKELELVVPTPSVILLPDVKAAAN